MGSETASGLHDDRDSDDDEDYEEAGGGNGLLGFMFGNVDNSGELEVDYLDEDAKEHLHALADKLGPSLTDINLSASSPGPQAAAATATGTAEDDFDEKADDAVDYEDIDEQYEGPEIETATEEEHLLPKREFLSVATSATTLGSPVFGDENYDEEYDVEKTYEAVPHESEVGTIFPTGFVLDPVDGEKFEPLDNNSLNKENAATDQLEIENGSSSAVGLTENDVAVFTKEICSKTLPVSGLVLTSYSAVSPNLQEEETVLAQDVADVRSSTPLPTLYVENEIAVLRFSEIFGINEPLKKAGIREYKYSFSKDKYTSLDSLFMVEENEDAFLEGSRQVFSSSPLLEAQDDYGTFMGDNPDYTKFDIPNGMRVLHAEGRDSCLSAEPMRKDAILDVSAEFQSCMSKEFYALDQQDWEDRIVWANSPVSSEISVESCELSGPDFESAAHEEREITSVPVNPSPSLECQTVPDDKDSRTCALPTFLVEPFDSRGSSSNLCVSSSEGPYHPQLLRLGSRLVGSSSDLSERKDLAADEQKQIDFMRRFKSLMLQNKDLVEGSWIENIIWESDKPIAKSKLILDLEDEQMVFEVLDDKHFKHLQAHAGAMITTGNGRFGSDVLELPGHMALSGGQFNIGSDSYYYSDRRTVPQSKSISKKPSANNLKYIHSIPALGLQTMKPKLSNKDIGNFHRPKAVWYPRDNELVVKELEKLPTQGPMKVILKSLGGKGSKFYVDAEDTVASLKGKASKKLDFVNEAVRIYYLGKELEDEKTLAEQNVQPNSLLHLVRTKIYLLPMAQKVPSEKKSLRPPGAFKRKSDLSAVDGHVFLMEYCEERPLLLGNPGMGAKLVTYYQKASSNDQSGDVLRKANSGLGTVSPLEPAEKSPFLGDVKPSSCQSALLTKLCRAPIFPHRVASTDYLLVRSPKGKLSVRRIDKIHVVGQQEPIREVMQPGSKSHQTYLMNRLLVYIYRVFRAAEKRAMPPRIRADELSALFPNIVEPLVRKKLKLCADFQKGPNGLSHYVKRRNFHIPPEEELRVMVTPEDVCAYESMQAGLYHLKRLGITRLVTHTSPTQLTALTSAMNQLPDEAIALAAASHIEREILRTPWSLSSNFVANCGQGKGNVERLEISGVGDPSGRGMGFSYVRIAPKPPISNALSKKKPVVARGTTVTGTDADLRRLSMEAAREVLLKFNIPEDQIEKLSRWHRIALIRKLSSEQAASGVKVDPTTISKYARGQRMSFLQLQQQAREKCQDIWDRQIQSLSALDSNENESDSEANSDLDSFAGDLENLLDAEEGEDGDEGILQMKNCKSDGVKGLKMRRLPPQVRFEEEMEDEKAEAAELCRMLMDDNEAKWKKKKKSKPSGKATGLIRDQQRNLNVGASLQVKRPSILVKQIDCAAVPNESSITKQIAEFKEIEKLHSKETISKKVKGAKKNEAVPLDLQNKKIKIMTEGIKMQEFNQKKSARESFVCGACGQLGHMRTNKHCPKYREDPDAQMNSIDPDNEAAKPIPQEPSQSQQTISVKKPTKALVDSGQAEVPEGNSSMKTKVLKVKYASADKINSVPSLNVEQPSTSEVDTGIKSAPKVIKIVSKTKVDDGQVESQKLNVVIRPPSDVSREQSHKRITIKQPKKDVINLDQISEEVCHIEYRKTKKMIELAGLNASRQQECLPLVEEVGRKRRREEEVNKRYVEEMLEQSIWQVEEDRRKLQQQERLADLRKKDIKRREKEAAEFRKVKKKKIKRTAELGDEDFRGKRKKDGGAKRKTVVELGSHTTECAPSSSKRRGGGEVGLNNIFGEVVDKLKAKRELFAFLKPVSKKEAPDYLDIIQRPMDLSTIKEKTRRLEYKSRHEFLNDVHQIRMNAHIYNEYRNPNIPPLADLLVDYCEDLLDERDHMLTDAEANIRDT